MVSVGLIKGRKQQLGSSHGLLPNGNWDRICFGFQEESKSVLVSCDHLVNDIDNSSGCQTDQRLMITFCPRPVRNFTGQNLNRCLTPSTTETFHHVNNPPQKKKRRGKTNNVRACVIGTCFSVVDFKEKATLRGAKGRRRGYARVEMETWYTKMFNHCLGQEAVPLPRKRPTCGNSGGIYLD